jgi:hypothetical protein
MVVKRATLLLIESSMIKTMMGKANVFVSYHFMRNKIIHNAKAVRMGVLIAHFQAGPKFV